MYPCQEAIPKSLLVCCPLLKLDFQMVQGNCWEVLSQTCENLFQSMTGFLTWVMLGRSVRAPDFSDDQNLFEFIWKVEVWVVLSLSVGQLVSHLPYWGPGCFIIKTLYCRTKQDTCSEWIFLKVPSHDLHEEMSLAFIRLKENWKVTCNKFSSYFAFSLLLELLIQEWFTSVQGNLIFEGIHRTLLSPECQAIVKKFFGTIVVISQHTSHKISCRCHHHVK